MEKLNEKVSVMPTERDFAVLKSLYDFVVMSFPQIGQRHFAGKAKPTIVNRLTKLESAGLIQRLKVPRLEIGGTQNVISVVFQITRLGILVLQKCHPEFELRSEPIKLRPYSVDHDLLLVDVMQAMKNKFPGCEVIHGELYFKDASHLGLRPDAVLLLSNGQGAVALELELTAKSEKRYRDLILKYRLTKDFTKVIYVISHRQIETKIKTILGPSHANQRFEFLQLGDVLGTSPNLENNNSSRQIDEERKVSI